MTTIHMDANAARAIQKRLLELQSSIVNVMRRPNTTVANLQPSWRANSAQEFFTLYSESSGRISEIVSKLGEIAEEIGEEIDRWERTADRLSH
jgi:uncharacterized protein YukE